MQSRAPVRQSSYAFPGRPTRPLARRRCRICGAILASDRPASATACSCHPGENEPYNPRQDKHLDEHVLVVLLCMEPVSVARKLDTKDHKAIWYAVRRLRQKGWVIEGVPGIGYQLTGFLHNDPAALRRAADYLEASG